MKRRGGRPAVDAGAQECKGCGNWFARNLGETVQNFQRRAYCHVECKQDSRFAKLMEQRKIIRAKLAAKAEKLDKQLQKMQQPASEPVTLAVDAQTQSKTPEESRPTFCEHAPGCPAIAQAWSQRIAVEGSR